MSTEEPGQNNNCWRIVPGNTRRSFDLHVIFIRLLSKPPQELSVSLQEPCRAFDDDDEEDIYMYINIYFYIYI